MSEPRRQSEKEPQTTLLHLNQFAPRKPGETPTRTGAEESPTLIIREAAKRAAEQSAQPVVAPKDGALPPKEMLGAVSYCYAKGVYRSEDIERKMRQDPELGKAAGGELPDAHAIRRFRRHNREAILATLGKFFRWRRAQRVTDPNASPVQPAPAPPENTQFFVKTEAADALDKAAWVDNMAKDD
jgi:hypothetical protein